MKLIRLSTLVSLLGALALGAGSALGETLPRVLIDRIEVLGVTVLNPSEVESAIDIGVGDMLERQKVVRSAENLQSLYRSRGFERVRVRSELTREPGESGLETVLRFKLDEGNPTRIGALRVLFDPGPDSLFQDYWKSDAKSVYERMGLDIGQVFNQDDLAAAQRVLLEALVSRDFIGVRIKESRVVDAPAVEGAGAAERWVGVEMVVDLGDRVTFGFRGNEAVGRNRLLALVEEQRLTGFEKDYVGAIQSRIVQEYQSIGFAKVQVSSYTFERTGRHERHVTYAIDEGPRYSIASIDFDGNAVYAARELRREFLKRSSALTQREIYVEKDVEKAAELLVEWLKSQGYLFAKLITITRKFHPDRPDVQLTIYVYEGERTIVRSVKVDGLAATTVDEVVRILGVSEGAPINLFAFNEGLETLKAAYRGRGYLDFRIANEGTDSVIVYSQDNRLADVHLELQEGPEYRVSRIEIEGLVKTREDVVRRELQLSDDDVIEEWKIVETERRLRKLGIFSVASVRLVDEQSRPGYKAIKVLIQEGTPGILAGGPGFRNDLGVRVFGQFAYTNLWNRNHTISLNANANRRFDEEFCSNAKQGEYVPAAQSYCFIELQAQLGYVWPWFGISELTFRPRISADRTQYRSFDADSVAFVPVWERNLIRDPNVTGILSYSLERIKQYNAQERVDNQTLTIGSITPSLYVDLRDDRLMPTRGMFASASYEIASRAFGSQSEPVPVGFTRLQVRSDFFFPVLRDATLYLSFRSGYARNSEPPPVGVSDPKKYSIPLIKQFTLGGAGSLRGFKEQELNATEFAILGTLSYVNYRAQLDLPFAGALRFGPFLDAANLLVDRYSFGILRYGAGLGFHYRSPVGPVNFDWGFKLDPRPNEDTNQFYFSIGVI